MLDEKFDSDISFLINLRYHFFCFMCLFMWCDNFHSFFMSLTSWFSRICLAGKPHSSKMKESWIHHHDLLCGSRTKLGNNIKYVYILAQLEFVNKWWWFNWKWSHQKLSLMMWNLFKQKKKVVLMFSIRSIFLIRNLTRMKIKRPCTLYVPNFLRSINHLHCNLTFSSSQ